jgi:hypothetical protein
MLAQPMVSALLLLMRRLMQYALVPALLISNLWHL